ANIRHELKLIDLEKDVTAKRPVRQADKVRRNSVVNNISMEALDKKVSPRKRSNSVNVTKRTSKTKIQDPKVPQYGG
ncbi:MAG: hypothetical protein K6A23_09420, partial [Butyrivibrio sp.]|nr:hypothetical protein [Butyrivibrio sp.]